MESQVKERNGLKQDATKGVQMAGISKRFGQVQALQDVDLSVVHVEVVGLVVDNGAGKSTLMKILAGAIKFDEGTITVDGQEYFFSNNGILVWF